MVAQWVVLLPHSFRVPGLFLSSGYCLCSNTFPCVCAVMVKNDISIFRLSIVFNMQLYIIILLHGNSRTDSKIDFFNSFLNLCMHAFEVLNSCHSSITLEEESSKL